MMERSRQVQSLSILRPLFPLIFLLIGDLLFVILHMVHKLRRRLVEYFLETEIVGGFVATFQTIDVEFRHTLISYLANPLFDIEIDNGYAENYQHLKFACIILSLCYLCVKNKTWLLLPWALLFTYFLLDDALQLHEGLGYMIAKGSGMTPLFGLRTQDMGEMIVMLSAGLIILPSLLIAYYFSRPTLKTIFHHLALILSFLIFFGVGIDMVHIMFRDYPVISQFLGLVEDGGEMLAVSIFGWYVFSLTKCSLNLNQAAIRPAYRFPGSVMANVLP
jgi:hypothetical protein